MTDRLFFALWPQAALRTELERRLPSLLVPTQGKPQRPDQWHVTLEFLGSVAADRQPAVLAAAARVRAEPFTVVFDALEHWRKPQVQCLVATRTPTPAVQFVDDLRAALRVEGFVPESRDFRPHVTLARKVRMAVAGPLDVPIAWRADRFALVRSITDPAGSRYEPLHWWNLRGRGD